MKRLMICFELLVKRTMQGDCVRQFSLSVGDPSRTEQGSYEMVGLGFFVDLNAFRRRCDSVLIHLGERAEKVGPSRKVEVLTDHDPHNREYQFADQACRDHTLIYFWLIEMVGDARPDWGTQVLRAMRDVIGRTGRVVVDLGGPNIAGDYLAYFFRGYEDLGLRLGPEKRWLDGRWGPRPSRTRGIDIAISHSRSW